VVNSGSGHDGIIRFGQETVDAVVVDLNDDGAEAALITGELKRLRPEVPVVIVVTEGQTLANGATKQADVLVPKSRESSLLVEAVRAVLPQQ
jgi:DNA-binding NarL/FixJ family response regulator